MATRIYRKIKRIVIYAQVFLSNQRPALASKFMPQCIHDATWKVLTSAFSEEVEEWKGEHCEPCTMAQACKKADLEKAVHRHLKDRHEDISAKEIKLSIDASFAFPSSLGSFYIDFLISLF